MPASRDVRAFDERAAGYDGGWLGRLHHEISERAAAIAAGVSESPRAVLDVGCGPGYLLRRLAHGYPTAEELTGLDPAPAMLAAATAPGDDPRLSFVRGVVEGLPFPDGRFDLVVSTTSFDHWSDQQLGLSECRRVLSTAGQLVLVDQFSNWLRPTLMGSRRAKARTTKRVERLLVGAGFGAPVWHDVFAVIIKAVTATT